jgi:hypothetical protein
LPCGHFGKRLSSNKAVALVNIMYIIW